MRWGSIDMGRVEGDCLVLPVYRWHLFICSKIAGKKFLIVEISGFRVIFQNLIILFLITIDRIIYDKCVSNLYMQKILFQNFSRI